MSRLRQKVENNYENREKLAKLVVDDWDLDTLKDFAIDILYERFDQDDDVFYADLNQYKSHFGVE